MTLKDFFEQNRNNEIALGFSGGVDSSYLLYAGHKYGANIRLYYVKTQFQPNFELEDAKRAVSDIGAEIKVIDYDILRHGEITTNTKNRCYYCKRKIFELIRKQALIDGCDIIIDGTNASDDADDRPGMKALKEMNVKSPLRLCGLNKSDIRRLSRQAGLFTWDKAAYACLATRIYENDGITQEKLCKIENAENILFKAGFKDFRVRIFNNAARLQFKENEMEKAFKIRNEIYDSLKCYFEDILLDLKGRS